MKQLFLIPAIFLLFSCSNDSAVSPNYRPGWQPPVVEGLNITDETGEFLETWGFTGSGQSNLVAGNLFRSSFLNSGNIFPNPVCGSATIKFNLPESASLHIWISPARWVNQPVTNFKFNKSSLLVTAEGARAVAILEDGTRKFFRVPMK